MRGVKLSVLFAVMLIILATDESYAASRINMPDIVGTRITKVTIAAPYFKGNAGDTGKSMTDLLHKDLDFTGFFVVAPMSLIDQELSGEGVRKDQIHFNNWRSIGVELVAKAEVTMVEGNIIMDAYLYDTTDGNVMIAKRYRGGRQEQRRIVHKFADDIVEAVTGQKGIMSLRLLFVAGSRTNREAYMADIDGQNVHKVTSFRSLLVSPSLSPDGRYLAYTSYREGRPNLYIMDVKSKQEVFADRDEGLKLGTGWKNNNTLGYAHSSGKRSTIYTVSPGSKSKHPVMRHESILASPAFSPDGSRMVYTSDMFGTPQIFLKNLSSGENRRLTYSGKNNTSPVFSPKGNLIAFVCNTGGSFEICLMGADGSNQRILTDGGFNDSPQFSPCGNYVVYYSRGGSRESVNIIMINGENKRVLRFTELNETQPRFIQ